MILSDRSIRNAIDRGAIIVEPEPTEEQFQPASLDVRLGKQLYRVSDDRMLVDEETHCLLPGETYIGHTRDNISLGTMFAAQLTGRSSVGRRGVIIHKTAGWIDPGFSGEITLELYNFTDEPVMLDVGSRVGQLVFFELDDAPDEPYDGQFQGQKGPTRFEDA